MDNIIDYQEISDAFQKEWLEHPLILTDDDPPRPDCERTDRKSVIGKIAKNEKKGPDWRRTV